MKQNSKTKPSSKAKPAKSKAKTPVKQNSKAPIKAPSKASLKPTSKTKQSVPLKTKASVKSTKPSTIKSTSKVKPKPPIKIKPKVAFYWCSSCGGCEETVVDLEEKILDVVAAVDIVFWPCAMDFKYDDVEAMPDQSITVSFINGAIRSSEQEEIAHLLRKKSQIVIAFGACAYMGGIPALANLKSKAGILERSYLKSPTVINKEKTLPDEKKLPQFYDTVYALDQVIDVDYYVPGCPPTSALLAQVVTLLLKGQLPPKGSVVGAKQSLCATCDRNSSKPDDLKTSVVKRIYQIQADPDKCFLAQGILCMGPATRAGCEGPCVSGNMPCTGCFGPLDGQDQGAKLIGAFGGFHTAETEKQVQEMVDSIPDPAGTFYRYGLSKSLLGSKRSNNKEGRS